jgi:hypothetical protein
MELSYVMMIFSAVYLPVGAEFNPNDLAIEGIPSCFTILADIRTFGR